MYHSRWVLFIFVCYITGSITEQFNEEMLADGVTILGWDESIATMDTSKATDWITVFGQFVVDCNSYSQSALIWTLKIPQDKLKLESLTNPLI